MFPRLSNIEGNIERAIKYNAAPSIASKKNAFIRVFSGAVVSGIEGLVMQSNIDFKLFKAAGDTGASIYGSSRGSGAIGTDWAGNPVETGAGRVLRPSPIITSFNSKEGKDQISRHAELEITAFSLNQMEAIQSYFLEPGYSLYIEWGWNTELAAKNATIASSKKTSSAIVSEIAEKSLNWNSLIKTRHDSDGEFDCFLGFIVGGSVSNDGENYKIQVKLRGAPSLPTYLQSYQGTSQTNASGVVINSNKVKQLYTTQDQEEDTSPSVRRRFAAMFNMLPSFRQTNEVKALETTVAENQFINFDKVVANSISLGLNDTGWSNWENDEDVEINGVSISKEKLFSNERYIRMDLAVLILNTIGAKDKYIIGGKEISFKIDIEHTVIGAFPFIFSTKADKLVIPGDLPDFLQYYLQTSTVEQMGGGPTGKGQLKVGGQLRSAVRQDDNLIPFAESEACKESGYSEDPKYWGKLKHLFVNFDMFYSKIEQKNKNTREIFLDILNEMSAAVNAFWNFQIVEGEFKPANRPPAKTWNPDPNNPLPADVQLRTAMALDIGMMYQLGAGGGGGTFTYVQGQGPIAPTTTNVNLVNITTNTGTVATISNTMTPGDVVITVIDENFVGKNPYKKDSVVTFRHIGADCVFLESNLDISMPADMTNKIVMTRLDAAANPDNAFIKVGGFFNSQTDLFLSKATNSGTNKPEPVDANAEAAAAAAAAQQQTLQALVDENLKYISKTQPVYGYSTATTINYYKKDADGKEVFVFSKTTTAVGTTTTGDAAEAAKYDKLQQDLSQADAAKVKELTQASVELAKTNLSTYLDKITTVPNSKAQSALVAEQEAIKTLIQNGGYSDFLRQNFCIYTFDDTEYLDRLKNDALGPRKGGSLSAPLPIKYSFKILGNSGIRRGDMFNISGIPARYAQRGIFQVTEIEHSFDGNLWVTDITGDYRQQQ
jgi:hypothetical protein